MAVRRGEPHPGVADIDNGCAMHGATIIVLLKSLAGWQVGQFNDLKGMERWNTSEPGFILIIQIQLKFLSQITTTGCIISFLEF